MAILAAATCAQEAWRVRSQWATAITMLLLLWSVSVQVTGSFFHPNGDWNTAPVNVDVAHNRLWDWRDPQILRAIKAGPFVDHLEPLKGEITR